MRVTEKSRLCSVRGTVFVCTEITVHLPCVCSHLCTIVPVSRLHGGLLRVADQYIQEQHTTVYGERFPRFECALTTRVLIII